MEATTIKISKETWKRLNKRKDVGETFDDVVKEILDRVENEGRKNRGL